jgi:hypothetical protein
MCHNALDGILWRDVLNLKWHSLDLCYIKTLKLKNDYFTSWLQLDYKVCGIYFTNICMFHSDLSSFLKFYLVWLVRSSATMSLCHTNFFKKNNQPQKKFKTYLASISTKFQGGYLITNPFA